MTQHSSSISALLTIAISLTLAAMQGTAQSNRTSAPSAGNPTAPNPLKIAQLDWYQANITTNFAVGNEPEGVAFDGANIWVANFSDGTVTKLQANDGTVLGTYTVGAGTQPYGVTFDGANIWVSSISSATVTKLQASTGKILGTFSVGTFNSPPGFMTFDGANIWVPNGQDNLTKLRASDGKNLGTFTVVDTEPSPG